MTHFVVLALRILGVFAGLGLIGFGIPLFFLPIPLGLILIILGILALTASSSHFVNIVRHFRRRHPKLDERLDRWAQASPRIVGRMLDRTSPNQS